jgi:hypothetical protein
MDTIKLKLAKNNQIWSEEEDQIIKNNYDKLKYKELSTLLPGRTYRAVATRARRLGLRKDERR